MKKTFLERLSACFHKKKQVEKCTYDFFVNGIYYKVLSFSNTKCAVTKGNGHYSGNVVIPNTVLYNGKTFIVTTIGKYVFEDCTDLTELSIGSNVRVIEEGAFWSCKRLKSLSIPASVVQIGNLAFYKCTGLKKLAIENSFDVLYLGYNNYKEDYQSIFFHCPLESVYMGRDIFYDSYYGYSPFFDKKMMKNIVIGEQVTNINEELFKGCESLSEINVPDNVTTINRDAFAGCLNLVDVKIGKSVVKIGHRAFHKCSNIKTFKVSNATPPEMIMGFDNLIYLNTTLFVPMGMINRYRENRYWKNYLKIVDIPT